MVALSRRLRAAQRANVNPANVGVAVRTIWNRRKLMVRGTGRTGKTRTFDMIAVTGSR
ncbi:MAG: hypothetical protein V7647_3358 [Acidobacteriota bacterium]|jgi:hypothetical protein